jgi:hypothetical protein
MCDEDTPDAEDDDPAELIESANKLRRQYAGYWSTRPRRMARGSHHSRVAYPPPTRLSDASPDGRIRTPAATSHRSA